MEASSPLAAMHRTMPAPSSWNGKEILRSPYAKPSSAGPRGLREQLAKGASDFFHVAKKDPRSTSPAASLAADLSQNFHLDKELSPRFPTPRRALFTANVVGGLGGRGFMTTPCMSSSSPAPLTEILAMSPLPHRAPFNSLLAITNSPSPSSKSAKDVSVHDSPVPLSRSNSLDFARPTLSERKKFVAARRPHPNRMKGLLASNMTKSFSSSDSQLSGSPSFIDSHSSTLSLEECFDTVSPAPDRTRPSVVNSPCPPIPLIRQRTQFAGVGAGRHGSPSTHARRTSNPFLRTRKQLRRSLSMFESPSDVMKSKSEVSPVNAGLKTINDIEEAHEPILPYFMADDPTDTIPRITRETMLEILDGKYCERYDHRMVIDCRFEYEYDGGHIDGAVNHNNKELLSRQLFETPIDGRSLLIFHCEYSAHRAPLMARHIRSQDRSINAENYPRLTYPEVYILDGGYSGFWAQHPARCFPPEYVEMNDEKHQRTCEREMGRLKARKGFGRAQTFAAFGKRDTSVFDSPTGPSKSNARNNATLNALGASPIFDGQGRNRRMASY